MHFNTFIFTTVMLALVDATPAMIRRFQNDTISDLPTTSTTSTTPGYGAEMPSTTSTAALFNSSTEPTGSVSTSLMQTVVTSVDSATLTYTLGPKGASSIVTTVIESTSTITLTTTLYITMTEVEEPTLTSGPTATVDGYGPASAYSSNQSPANGGGIKSSIDNGDNTTPTNPGSDSSATYAGIQPSNTVEPTVTTTDYYTTTETITMQAVNTGSGDASGSAGQPGAQPLFQSNSPGSISGLYGSQSDGCGVITVTATIVEKSTVTVTPTLTDNLPIPLTATPNYGSGNATNQLTGYPTASSGFLTYLTHSKATRLA